MKIPIILYGTYKDVKARCRKIITRLKRGETWEEIFAKEEYVDTATHPGLIILDGPSPLVGGKTYFHCYVLHRELNCNSHYGAHITDEIYYASLKSAWSLIAMVKEPVVFPFYTWENQIDIMNKERILAFWGAQLLFWDEIQNVGKRYWGSSDGNTAWSLGSFLQSVLWLYEMKAITIPIDGYSTRMHIYNDPNAVISKEKLAELVHTAKEEIDFICEYHYRERLRNKALAEERAREADIEDED